MKFFEQANLRNDGIKKRIKAQSIFVFLYFLATLSMIWGEIFGRYNGSWSADKFWKIFKLYQLSAVC